MEEVVLKIENLHKKYHENGKEVIKGIDLEVKEGEIFGFLGRNGVGKSTTIKCITGLHDFNEGKITINGFDLLKEPLKAKQSFGFVSDNHACYESMTGREYVDFIASIYGKVEDYEEYFNSLVDYFEIKDSIDLLISDYSHGMKQKISLIASLIHKPKLWILDEPLTGLDILITKRLLDKMVQYKESGNSIFLTSHNIDLVGKICDRIAILSQGEIKTIIDCHESKENLEDLFFNLTEE